MSWLLAFILRLGAIVAFSWDVLRCMFTRPRYIHETLKISEVLVKRCIIPVSLAVAPVGAVISLQGIHIFQLFGAERLLSQFLGMAIFREYSPALASVMVAAQAGSSIAARIGTMKVRGQVDALAVMSIDPVRYVVVPGVVACVIVTPLLSVLTNILGIFSGWVFAVPLGGIDHGAFMEHLTAQVTGTDLWVGLGKCAIFGTGVGLIAGYLGLNVGRGAADVGKAANDTVVSTIVLILFTDYVVSMVLLGLGL